MKDTMRLNVLDPFTSLGPKVDKPKEKKTYTKRKDDVRPGISIENGKMIFDPFKSDHIPSPDKTTKVTDICLNEIVQTVESCSRAGSFYYLSILPKHLSSRSVLDQSLRIGVWGSGSDDQVNIIANTVKTL